MEENPKKNFQFLNPITQAKVPSFHLGGAGSLDFVSLKKNLPHLEELAVNFGLQGIRGAILKNTLSLFQTRPSPKRPEPQFAVETEGTDQTLKQIGTSVFGFPVYSNLLIEGDYYSDNNGQVIGRYEDIVLDAVIFEITRENLIIQTDIQGRDNSVIEYISAKSWNINCKGRVMSNNRNTYPRTDVDNLIVALNSNKSLKVNSWFLNMAKIYNIVIKKKTIPQEEGSIEYQKFEFDAIADAPTILKIK